MSYDANAHIFTCPICSTKSPNAIVCGSCTSDRLEAIRNSVIENEQKNDLMRQEIDAIFSIIHGESQRLPIMVSLPGIPIPTSAAIGKLDMSIKKLELHNLRSKNHSIQRASKSLERKISATKAEIHQQKLSNIELRQSVETARSRMVNMANTKLASLDKEQAEIKFKTECYAYRQSCSVQLAHFRVIREAWLSSTTPTLRHARIIPLQEFAAENYQIGSVNTFLEDCIRIQVLLFDLFAIQDSQLDLPYLQQLRKLLPDTPFYDSIQNKISTLMASNDEESEEERPPEPVNNFEHMDKITIKDNVLQVPRSTRTMNLQRRSSVRPADTAQASEQLASPAKQETKEAALEASKGKRIVIVPHKLLKKPFSKLEPGEYLKFVSVVVKILVNFNCLIRGVASFYGHNTSKKFSYDFLEIFDKIYKLEDILKAAELNDSRSRKQESGQPCTESLQSSLTTFDSGSSAEVSTHSKVSVKAPQDGALKRVYNKYLLGREQPVPAPRKTMNNMDGIIYGLISEAKERNPKPEPQIPMQSHVSTETFDLKDIMGRVHGIIASGGGGNRAFYRGAQSQDFEATVSMMERSKVHLEDWNYVSRMY